MANLNPDTVKALSERSDAEISNKLFLEDEPQIVDLIIVLGNREENICRKRARRGAQLYRGGYAPKIVVSGGDNGCFIEAETMIDEIVQQCHVGEEAVLRDSHSKTTRDNFEKVDEVLKKEKLYKDDLRVILVSCPWHMLRAKHLTKKQFPQFQILCCPHKESCGPKEWFNCSRCRKLIRDGTVKYFSESYIVERDKLFS